MKALSSTVLVGIMVVTVFTSHAISEYKGKSNPVRPTMADRLLESPNAITGGHSKEGKFEFNEYVNRVLPIADTSGSWGRRSLLLSQGALDAVGAREEIANEKEGEMTAEQAAELMANPFSYLWFGMIQNDTSWWDGDLLDVLNEDKKVMNTTLIQPVMSLQWSEKWRLIFRPVIPIQSFDAIKGFDIIEDEPEGPGIVGDFKRETGLGDIVLWTAFSPQYTPTLVYGFGPTIMMDTACKEALGTGKWRAPSSAWVTST